MTSNKNQKMTYFIWILVYALVITLVSINTVKISPYTLFDYDDSKNAKFYMSNQIVESNGSYQVTGNDGFIVFSLDQEFTLWNGCISFEEKLDQNVTIEIFYSDDKCYFTQDDSFLINAFKGDDSIIFDLPEEDIKFIRIDVMPKMEETVPFFSLNVVEENYSNVIFALFSFSNVIAILVLMVAILLIRKFYCDLLKKGKNVDLLIIWTIVTAMFCILYGKFIRGDFVYIYSDIGRDTIDSYWPRFLLSLGFVNEFENFGYTLQKGLGEFVSDGIIRFTNPFDWIFFIIEPTKAVLVALYLKIIWISGFAWAYFKKMFSRRETILVCTILWTFSGWFILWGQHYWFATAYAYFTAILFFLEKLIDKDKSLVFMVIPLALLTGSSYYFTYIIGVFSIVYLVIRGIHKKLGLKNIVKLVVLLGVLELVAIFISAIMLYPALASFLQSSRTSSLKVSWLEMLEPRTIDYLLVFLGRILSTDFWGRGNDYTGTFNYYEMSINYASVLFVIACVYLIINKYHKRVLLFFLTCIIGVMIPLASKLIQFQAITLRWTLVFNVGIILIIGCFLEKLWNNIEKKENKILYKTLVISDTFIVVWILLLNLLGKEFAPKLKMDSDVLTKLIIFWVAVNVILILLTIKKTYNYKIVVMCVLGFVCIEQVVMNYDVINQRKAIDKSLYNLSYYNDGTEYVVDKLNLVDSSLYRINKTYMSQFYNDASAQGYNGVSSYSSTHSNELIETMNVLNIPFSFGHPNYILVSYKDRYVNQLLSVKYLISKSEQANNMYYKKVFSGSGFYVYEDLKALPFGYLYSNKLDADDFLALETIDDRSAALMLGFYSENEELEYTEVSVDENTLQRLAKSGRESLIDTNISNVKLEDDVYTATVINDTGSKAMLCVPLIYDKHWRASVDGQVVQLNKINGGLMGVELPEGQHNVNIEYICTDYMVAMWISIVSTIIYLIVIVIIVKKNTVKQ
ncbi:MAG: hypothetical protein E7263_05490 [Lachnospiraceae bacterium]|nr:hypothetical protein [Lachnospiraceae bacterium]